MKSPFAVDVTPDWEGLDRCIRREGTPARVHHIELFLDLEVQNTLCERFDILNGLDPADPFFPLRKQITLQAWLGYDYVRGGVDVFEMPLRHGITDDTADTKRAGGRAFVDENRGPITNWEEFEEYPWPDPVQLTTRNLEWLEENLPENMCIIGGGGFAHYAEYLTWLMGYSTFCIALYEQRDLIQAIYDKLHALFRVSAQKILSFDRVKMLWGSDDMGFKGSLLMSPDDMREFVLAGHKEMARMAHESGRPYLLHSCGNLELIMEDLIEDVGMDAKHSFEDTIENVIDLKRTYGQRIALLGGIDMDFLCRASADEVRHRVRKTLDACMPGGGYCLGSGNSVANYIPLENYLAMVDEGRRYSG